jgi:palmitoyltransferase ZDHHC9/14/18
VASLAVVFAIAGVYFGTTAIWWWKNENIVVPIVAVYMTLLTISSMMATVRHLWRCRESIAADR